MPDHSTSALPCRTIPSDADAGRRCAWRASSCAIVLALALLGWQGAARRGAAGERAGAGGADRRARGDRAGRAVLGRRAPAHQGPLARLLAQPRRFRARRRHQLAAAAGLRGRADRLADAAAHPRRPPRQLRLRARDDAAHAHHAAGHARRRRTPSPSPPTSPGWCARRNASPARRACRSRLPAAGTGAAPGVDAAHRRASSMPRARSPAATLAVAPRAWSSRRIG